jgi:hypothetical protein
MMYLVFFFITCMPFRRSGYLIGLLYAAGFPLDSLYSFLDLRLHTRSAVTSSLLGRPGKRQNRGPRANIKAMLLAGSKYSAICNHSSDGILATADETFGLANGKWASRTMQTRVADVSSGTILWRISVG